MLQTVPSASAERPHSPHASVSPAKAAERPTPPSYQPARWHGTLPSDGSTIGIAFDISGQTLRYALPLADARHLQESLQNYLSLVQSARLGEMPSDAVSPHDGVKV